MRNFKGYRTRAISAVSIARLPVKPAPNITGITHGASMSGALSKLFLIATRVNEEDSVAQS